ncbi:tRNA (adenosine(37)-N6)-methyltransferase TrmM [Vibrio panuliri]|uniref:tRNA1(Val) (adenine(37)-N6)-methyltransferase n=1 Tax=Vibrio panuliri TaxID=1381081 RepID=A0A1Q9H9Q9_9VIBR|nr:tRNA1(Val) (adenine(37)-N6)-methyltransferase [Vibrio panuliri]OLQ85613.1 tRNA (adenosine(37)-N6)-methyltransferase TrmM [Vibrio panuliri]
MSKTFHKTKGFRFKQFTIDGGECGMPVSTDGVLLGAWSDLEGMHRILDIGTGTGLLALMCAQRQPSADIWAVDIEESAAVTAQLNVTHSPWSEQIRVELGDINTMTYPEPFDAVICNPPYFNNGEQSQSQQRATARHTGSLSHQALLARCKTLLHPQGRANFILPVVEGEAFIELAQKQGWSLTRLCRVKPTDNKAENRLLIELAQQGDQCQLEHLTIRNKNGYSDEFVALTKDFYLKM